jgi:hypothetical protein
MRKNIFFLENAGPEIETVSESVIVALRRGFAGSYERGGVLGNVESLLQQIVVGGLFISEFAGTLEPSDEDG